jgi:glutathione synthase/RimK-type ligase-like ATP-grasp enzyme
MDHRALPEIRNEPVDSPARLHADRFHDALYEWLEMTSARVVNRLSSMASNGSKPYQAGLVQRFGFDTPETLVTSDPAQVGAFQRRFGDVVYKSISGVRSIVTTLKEDDVRLDRIRWCPVQFQERVAGTDVRVHVVGDEVFATRVRSTATDYRYAGEQVGAMAVLEPLDLSAEVAARCVDMTAAMGLAFSGIDLRFAEDGRVICFEVNPSPGFSYFEANTGQPIASAVAAYLAGGADARSRSAHSQAGTERPPGDL